MMIAMAEPTAHADETRAGYVAIIGAPNAGKSTLVNRLVDAKVSIVTHKVQTTRSIIRGITQYGTCQIVFVDTPGIFSPRRTLDRAMVATAWGGARDADIVAALIDCQRGMRDDTKELLKRAGSGRRPLVVLLNKIDLIAREKLLAIAEAAQTIAEPDRLLMISAKTGDGCADFMDYLAENLPQSPWFFPQDQVSDLPMRQLAAEITREMLYLRLHQELPYACHVETEAWVENPNGNVRIDQVIYVERQGQKKILIGRNGASIKAISTGARRELAEILGTEVHLFLFVKVRENWSDDPARYREIGLDFPK